MPSRDNSRVPAGIVKFGDGFEIDRTAFELRRTGRPQKLERIPMEMLLLLLDQRGQLVTREEIMGAVWGKSVFLDSDNSINAAISKIRQVLRDDPENPKFVQTVKGKGYRFIASVAEVEAPDPLPAAVAEPERKWEPIQGSSPPPALPVRRRWVPVVASLVLLGAAAALILNFFYRKPVLTEKDTVVLADFTNKTGDPVFDETLRQGMAIELEQSPFLSLVSDGRIHQTLRLMGKPQDARLSPEIARELCERTGSVAVLDGSIVNLGSQYVLGLRARSCAAGNVLAEEQAQALRKEEILNTLSNVAGRFRVRLGESLRTVQQHEAPLAEATTSSLEALKAYTAANNILFSGSFVPAVALYQRAIEIDPQFAVAYSYLGRAYGDMGESELSAKYSLKAYELRDRASDEERYWISASYDKQVTGNLEKAEQTCALWVQAYPRAKAPHGFLSGNISIVRGNYKKSVDEAKIGLEIDPDFSIIYSNLALSYLALGQIDAAENTLLRASSRKLDLPDYSIQRFMIAFLKGDKAAMQREASQSHERPEAKESMSNAEGFVLAYSGHLQEARKMSRQAVDFALEADHKETAALYETDAALREALFGNASTARQMAITALQRSRSRDVEYGVAAALAISGESSRSQNLAEDLSRRFSEDTKVRFAYLPTLRALLALNHIVPSKAVELLQTSVPYEDGVRAAGVEILIGAGTLYTAYVRGQAYLALRQGPEAAQEFQKILDHPGIVLSDPIGALAHLQLGRAYALAADKDKAVAAYKDFLTLWNGADPNIPILNQAKAEFTKRQY